MPRNELFNASTSISHLKVMNCDSYLVKHSLCHQLMSMHGGHWGGGGGGGGGAKTNRLSIYKLPSTEVCIYIFI